MPDDKAPQILMEVLSGDKPVVGFSPVDMNRPMTFVFADGSKRTATLVNANAHCAYDDEGKPRNLLINLDFK